MHDCRKQRKIGLVNLVLFLSVLLLCFLQSPHVTALMKDAQWEIHKAGATISVNLIAPHTIDTGSEYWFNTSATVIALNSDPPYEAQYVYFFGLIVRYLAPNSASQGSIHTDEPFEVGGRIQRNKRISLDSFEAALYPGQARTLTYEIQLNISIQAQNGSQTLSLHNFGYDFEVLARQDDTSYLSYVQQTQLGMIAMAGVIIVIIIGVLVGVSYKRHKT